MAAAAGETNGRGGVARTVDHKRLSSSLTPMCVPPAAAHPLLFTASALLGVVASMLTFLVIKLTNSVTLKVINTARNAAFVLVTVTVLGEEASGLQICGYCVSLAAFSAYTYFKLNRM